MGGWVGGWYLDYVDQGEFLGCGNDDGSVESY